MKATVGVSLIGSVIGVRRAYVANQKLDIVTAEVKSRGLTPYQPRKRDFTIPIIVCIASLGLGVGTTIASFDVSSQGVAEGLASPDPVVLDEAVNQPTEMSHDVVQGVETQVEEVAATVTGNGGEDMTAAVNESIVEQTAAGFDPSAFAMGQGLAQAAEVLAVQSAFEPLAYCFKGQDDKKSQVCTLSTPKECSHAFVRCCFGCNEQVTAKEHYHCCVCHRQGFLFNLCEPCLLTLRYECYAPEKHILYRVVEGEKLSKGPAEIRVQSVSAEVVA